jgi:hypothetical protein
MTDETTQRKKARRSDYGTSRTDWAPRYHALCEFAKKRKNPFSVKQLIAAAEKAKHDYISEKSRTQTTSMVQLLEAAGVFKCVQPAHGVMPSLYTPGPHMKRYKTRLKEVEAMLGMITPQTGTKQRRDAFKEQLEILKNGGTPLHITKWKLKPATQKKRPTTEEEVVQAIIEEPEPAPPRRAEPKPRPNGHDTIDDFLINGSLPPGLVLLKRNGTWALGTPEDVSRILRGS